MTYRKSTLRRLPPTTRKVARLIAELDSTTRRAKNLLEQITLLELDSIALHKRNELTKLPAPDSVTCPNCWTDHTGHLKHGDTCPECGAKLP